jgi:uncharacterized protein
MRFEWDEEKNRRNLTKHGVRFETAALAFEDAYALTDRNLFPDEERWDTLGSVGSGILLFVVHTWHEVDEDEVVRIISARRAESHERKLYEEAQQRAERRHRKARRHVRRRH